MSESDDRRLLHEGLAFFGRIMAAQSHEITNVFNTINELNGLQQDIMAGAGQQPTASERLKQITEKIGIQLQRGQSIIRAINGFAHSVDRPRCSCDLREVLDGITFLAQRAARLATTTLEQKYPADSIVLETDPFTFAQAVYVCIEMALAASSEARRISVSYQTVAAGAEVTVTSGDPIALTPSVLDKQALLGLLMRELGGRVVVAPGAGDAHRLALFVPCQAPAMPVADVAADGYTAEDTNAS